MGVWYRIILLLTTLTWAPYPAGAGTALFTHHDEDGVTVFSDTPLNNGEFERRSYRSSTRPVVDANPCKGLTLAQLDARGRELDTHLRQVATQYALDMALIKAVARAESCFDPLAVSRAGARGLMQLMPDTAKEMGVTDIHDKTQNLHGGAKYLSQMLSRYSADTHLALAAYNAGPGNVDHYQGVPPFPETRRYIASVLRYKELYSSSTPASPAAEPPSRLSAIP
jgi:soluble lytic murein transglycosylase-like protein